MGEARLVTLVGPGGVGKTRLAVESASEARRAFGDGVCLVDLASVNDPSRIAEAVAAALNIRDQSSRDVESKVGAHLEGRHLLAIFDNCEHLLPGCAMLIADFLRRAPNLHVLATSREELGVSGEHLYRVAPLSVPDPAFPPTLQTLTQYESVHLLIDRATAVRGDFRVSSENLESVVQLVTALDGVPFAIELAAVRMRSLSVGQVVERLDDRFSLLTGGSRDVHSRQRTLRGLIDWSFDLCTGPEQRLWTRLSVFPGTFDLTAAESVGSDDLQPAESVIDLLDHLVAKSIVTVDGNSHQVRYRLPVSIREYGLQLLDDGDEEEARRRHRNHYLSAASQMVERWCGAGQARRLEQMRADHPNLVAALAWSIETPGETLAAAEFVALLRFHWIVGGFLSEGRRWLDEILERATEPTAERGAALWVAAWIYLVQGDLASGQERLRECGVIADELSDGALVSHVSHWSGVSHLFAGDLTMAIACLEQAVRGHRAADDTNSQLVATFQLLVALGYAGDLDRAGDMCAASLAICEELDEHWNRAYLLWTRGLIAWHAGDLDAAEDVTRRALEEQRPFRDGINAALTIELLGWVAAAKSEFASAASRTVAADAVWGAIGTTMNAFGPHMTADAGRAREAVLSGLGRRQFKAACSGTSALGVEAAIDVALGAASVADSSSEAADSPLTPRERDVAELIATGLTNRAIAETLILSPRTIDGHVERILNKLGFTSRVQVATWFAESVSHADGHHEGRCAGRSDPKES